MILSESRRLRIAAFTSLYFCQGVPIGLLDIAMPGWLAQQGVAPSDIASYTAVVGLPWAFKLVVGPFMDRFGFPAMGYRRPWVMAAQFGLTVALTLFALTATGGDLQLTTLMVFGFLINSFGASQDVAVDGMAIDLLPLDERGRANAFMGFGQVFGFSVFGAAAGWMLAVWGLAVAAGIAALLVGSVLTFVILARERAGERRLPWSAGEAARTDRKVTVTVMFSQLLRSIVLPQSLVLSVSAFLLRASSGIAISLFPVLAVQRLGFTGAEYSAYYGWAAGAGAVLGLLVGPLIDRFGARVTLAAGLVGNAATVLVFVFTSAWWGDPVWVVACLFVLMAFDQVVFVSIIAQFMNITWPRIAATQFAVYMAYANLARSTGAGAYSTVADTWTAELSLTVMAGLWLTAAIALLAFRQDRHAEQLSRLENRMVGVSS